jgi:hypothetical protein
MPQARVKFGELKIYLWFLLLLIFLIEFGFPLYSILDIGDLNEKEYKKIFKASNDTF